MPDKVLGSISIRELQLKEILCLVLFVTSPMPVVSFVFSATLDSLVLVNDVSCCRYAMLLDVLLVHRGEKTNPAYN